MFFVLIEYAVPSFICVWPGFVCYFYLVAIVFILVVRGDELVVTITT